MVSVPVPISPGFERALVLSRASLFLHFVNRELIYLRKSKLVEDHHIKLIKNCSLMTCGYILAPFAQVHELYYGKRKINHLIQALCSQDKLHLTNRATDYYSFLEDRRELYSGRKDRYGMYYKQGNFNRSLYRSSANLDTTSYIKTTLIQAVDEPSHVGNLLSLDETRRLNTNSDYIRYLYNNTGSAATFSVYETSDLTPKPSAVAFLGNVSCRLFVTHYSNQHELVVPTGFTDDVLVESFDYFPIFDLELNRILLDRLGLSPIVEDTAFHQPLINLLSDRDFVEFNQSRVRLMLALTASAGSTLGGGIGQRYKIAPHIRSLDFGEVSSSQPQSAAALVERIKLAMTRAAQTDMYFAEAMEKAHMIEQQSQKIIVFTATDLEDEIFLSTAAISGFQFVELKTFLGFSAGLYSKGQTRLYHVRTSAGSSGMHGSARMSEKALAEIRPAFAFSVGIAFGLDENVQKLGDVLASEYVVSYERIKISEGKTEFRGDKIPCSSDFVSLARQYRHLEKSFKVHVGGILSGDKLVDDRDYRDELQSLDPKSIGGEMESAGIVISCAATLVPFALLKGISDFAAGKTDKAQRQAATNSFSTLFQMIERFEASGIFKN